MGKTNLITIKDSKFSKRTIYKFSYLIHGSNLYFPIVLVYVLLIKMIALKISDDTIYFIN